MWNVIIIFDLLMKICRMINKNIDICNDLSVSVFDGLQFDELLDTQLVSKWFCFYYFFELIEV